MADRAFLERLSRELADKGKLIESGWVAMRLQWIPLDAPKEQLDELREAFFAGAQHLFGSIMTMLEPGANETPADLHRMDQIHAELQKFIQEYKLRHFPTKGTA